MGFYLKKGEANEFLTELKKEYQLFAPKRYTNVGRYSDTDIIR